MTNGFNPGYPMNTCTGPGMSIPVSEPERVLYEVTKSNAEMVAAVNTLHNNTQKSLYDNQKLMERMARKSKKLHGKPCIMIGGMEFIALLSYMMMGLLRNLNLFLT